MIDNSSWFHSLPLSGVFALTAALVIVPVAIGVRVGVIVRRRFQIEESVGSTVGATLGLLAFMLAFTFNMAANRFDARKQLYVDEISAIGTTYLRAGLLPSPQSVEARRLLREYVDQRVDVMREPARLPAVLPAVEALQKKLWSLVENLQAQQSLTVPQSLFAQSLNETIDLHGMRIVVGIQFQIPATIWLGLMAVAVLAMLMVGYEYAQAKRRQWIVTAILALTFASVVTLIADLDRAGEGSVRINPQPMIDLQKSLQATN